MDAPLFWVWFPQAIIAIVLIIIAIAVSSPLAFYIASVGALFLYWSASTWVMATGGNGFAGNTTYMLLGAIGLLVIGLVMTAQGKKAGRPKKQKNDERNSTNHVPGFKS